MFRISWDLQQLSLSECVTHFLLRFWPSAQFAIAPKPFKVEVSCSNDNILLKSSEAATGGGAAEVRGQPGGGAVQQLHLGPHSCRRGWQEQGCAGWATFFGGRLIRSTFSRPSQCALPWSASAEATRRPFPQCWGAVTGGSQLSPSTTSPTIDNTKGRCARKSQRPANRGENLFRKQRMVTETRRIKTPWRIKIPWRT